MAKKKWLSPKQAADFCGVSAAYLYARRRRGQSPKFYRMGWKVLYDEADLDAFINEVCAVHLNAAHG